MKKSILLVTILCCVMLKSMAQIVSDTKTNFALTDAAILVDKNEDALILKSAALLQQDIELVTGKKIPLIHHANATAKNLIVIGSLDKSAFIKELTASKKINTASIKNKWEAYHIQSLNSPLRGAGGLSLRGAGALLVIAGSDRRGVAFGVFELSKQMGVSPWYWWADVPVPKKKEIFINAKASVTDAPKVKYRGIFINDEAPALSNWSKEKFGGFNHLFYGKVFELMLRLKSNYIWPAMWGNAFYDDDSLNIKTADEYGIVIGTSHHEPLMRAHAEWSRYGKGKWNYDSNQAQLQDFWRKGMQRASNEKIVSVGMRGDGDEPMSRETATALLERIVTDQRRIIKEATGKPAAQTPQLWALYKEVQDYYDKGMRVPDDVTLLLCDDNWGNLRKLPKITDKPRKGGYGIYYHFDYVGGPRNYKWINTNPLPRIWEQMHLAWEHNVKDIWIVNVGDIKPMEFPISFFLDYAWNPDKIGAGDLEAYTERWAAAQFGAQHSKDIAELLAMYAKYNGRRKPEMLDANTYSLENYNEFTNVVKDYNELNSKAEIINNLLPPAYRDAYFQLVLHPVKAGANLNEMYYYAALNKQAYKNKLPQVNEYADRVKSLYQKDSMISLEYHQLKNGKWNHMMSQTHIGYTNWQQPPFNKMPEVKYLQADSLSEKIEEVVSLLKADHPLDKGKNIFYEYFNYVSIEANHFTKAINSKTITWKVLPDHGKTGSAVAPFPVTAPVQKPAGNSPQLQYEFYTYSEGDFKINAYFSPTLNFHSTAEGLQYAISVDDETPQVISINNDDKSTEGGINYNWVGNNIIIKISNHKILTPGKHTVKYWMVHPGVVLQKIVLDFGGVNPSYLGPPETKWN